MMQVVLVLADAYWLMLLSGKISFNGGLRSSVNASGMLCCTRELTIFTSALVVYIKDMKPWYHAHLHCICTHVRSLTVTNQHTQHSRRISHMNTKKRTLFKEDVDAENAWPILAVCCKELAFRWC